MGQDTKEIVFECTNTRTDNPEEPPVFEHFRSTEWRAYDDGAGYVDVKCMDSCPYCGETGHWMQASHSDFIEDRKT